MKLFEDICGVVFASLLLSVLAFCLFSLIRMLGVESIYLFVFMAVAWFAVRAYKRW